ncbi:MAG: DUF255 domain-containing protein [Chloroflexi bacterium]|nr:DUF255 domain-containing protein [Chloroflexota bacterium]
MSHTLVRWREWTDDAFAEAQLQDKPILLHIGAVWCHWCHVMDRGVPGDPVHTGVYSNAELAAYVNEHFIPIRVDNDQRPDINARYNMGGWPTTCFLTTSGEVIYGATYLAPSQMRSLMPQVVDVWRNHRDDLLQRMKEAKSETEASPAAVASLLPANAVQEIANLVIRNFDPKNGGLGANQKFPMSDAWQLLHMLAAESNEVRLRQMVEQTCVAMGTRGMYDRVAGGWFRYSTTPDWSVPHFEKMLEDHARLLPVYLGAIQLAEDEQVRATLTAVVNASLEYLMGTLLHDADGAAYFFGSQDADEHYYTLSKFERAQLDAPFIDRRLYVDWNALMISALLQASVVLDRPELAALALRVWRTLQTLCIDADGIATHSIEFVAGAPRPQALRGQLGDHAALARAALDLAQHDCANCAAHMASARALIECVERTLASSDGGYFDSPDAGSKHGLLRVRLRPIFDNCAMAEALLTYDALNGAGASRASRVLAAFADEYARYREHGAPYALALWKAMREPIEIVVVGAEADAAPFAHAAFQKFAAWRLVRVLDPQRDAAEITVRGYPIAQLPAAFVCKGTTCSAPIFDAGDL